MNDELRINVRKTITGIGRAVYSAWEPAVAGSHAVTETNGRPMAAFDRGVPIIGSSVQTLGQVGSKRIPPELQALPPGEDRYQRCQAWQTEEMRRAHRAILEAHPEAAEGQPLGCEVHVFFDEPAVRTKAFLLEQYVQLELPGQVALGQLVQEAFSERLADEPESEEPRAYIPTRVVLQPRGVDVGQLAQVPIALVTELEGEGWWLAIEVQEQKGATPVRA